MSTLAERINEVIHKKGMTVTEIAKTCGVTTAAVAQWRGGGIKTIRPGAAARLAAATGYNAIWLATGEGVAKRMGFQGGAIQLDDNPAYPAVRRVRLKMSAGISGFAVEADTEDDTPIVFKESWFTARGYKADKLLAVRVKGSSMEPGIYDGDTVVINTAQQEPRDGHVFAVNYEGELVIKRLQRDAGEWLLSSDNPNKAHHPTKRFTEGTFLIGEIVHKQSERI